jgi:hypothetical protein
VACRAAAYLQVGTPQVVVQMHHTCVLRVGCCIGIEPALHHTSTHTHSARKQVA